MQPFEKLRREAPFITHPIAPMGRFGLSPADLIKQVDTDHTVSSERGGISIVDTPPPAKEPKPGDDGISIAAKSFINMDELEHKKQRLAVSPSVSPRNLAEFEPLIRERSRYS